MDTLENRQVGEFVIHEQIGSGGFATVYRAYQPTVNRYVALKVIDVNLEAGSRDALLFERRFAQEAEVLASLEHPHIVPIYHYGIVGDKFAYIAMRLMHESLHEMLRNAPLPPDQVADVVLQLITGLEYAHKKGVIHRDLKPGNILFDEAGSACLADFGLINATALSLEPTQLGRLTGVAMYVAPEQIRGSGADERSDIYSLGVIMYQMLTGHFPFEAENLSVAALLQQIEYDEPTPPRKLNPAIPVEIERVVMQALRKEPRERFVKVHEMAEALDTLPSQRVALRRRALAARKATHAPAPARRSRPPRWLVLSAALVALLIIAALLHSFAAQDAPPQTPTVESDTRGTIADAAPSASEIAQAQRQLGANGFIAYIACGLDSQFDAARSDEMQSFAQADGLAYRSYDSSDDAYKQLTLIEQARLEGARALIICPMKPDLLNDSLTSVQSAGIPLVLTDRLSKNYGGVMIDPDDEALGAQAGRLAASALAGRSSARVIILDAPDFSFSDAREQGFIDALTGSLPGAQVVGRYSTADDQAASASAISGLLSQQQPFDAVFSVDDRGAYGAIDALTLGHVAPGTVRVVSVGAESQAISDVNNRDYLLASVDPEREAGSRGALDAAVKLLGGGTIPEILALPPGNVMPNSAVVGPTPQS